MIGSGAPDLFVVPTERHVERLARSGARAETRTSLAQRLASALLADVHFADPREARLLLAMAIADPAATAASGARPQLELFASLTAPPPGGVPAAAPGTTDTFLAALRARGGASWARAALALDDAVGVLRARGVTAKLLDRVADKGFSAARARTLGAAMRLLDDRLAASSLRDPRLLGASLAEAIAAAPPERVLAVLGARTLVSRWVLGWEPSDLAWWRALDQVLARAGGFARVSLPSFDRPLEGDRERDPLETLSDEVARGLDDAPIAEPIAARLGDLAGHAPAPEELARGRVRVVVTAHAVAQAREVAVAVSSAIRSGVPVERVAVACPSLDERTLGPLRRALDDARIVTYEGRAPKPLDAGVVAASFLALDVASRFDRIAMARLLRSGYVDATALVPEPMRAREAQRVLERLARSLEARATAEGPDAAVRLVRTAEDATLASSVVAPFVRARDIAAPRTRAARVASARTLFREIGIPSRAGRGALVAFTSDAAPAGAPAVERQAVVRDARAWEALSAALDTYENVAVRARTGEHVVDDDVFKAELGELLSGGASAPGAGRAGAVRIARLGDVVGDELDLLVVIDVNDGVLPSEPGPDPLVSEALSSVLERAGRGTVVAPSATGRRARQLAALAVAAAEAKEVVLSAVREDSAGAPIEVAALIDVLERAGARVERGAPSAPRGASSRDVVEAREAIRLRIRRERAREGFFFDPRRPLVDTVGDLRGSPALPRLVAPTGGGARPLAVTSLERFARCPFMGFAHVVLLSREIDRKGELPDAREEGSVVHEALAAAFVATRDLWPKRPRDAAAILRGGLAACDEVLAKSGGHAPLRAVVGLRVRDSVRAMLLYAIREDAWDFGFAEQPFGGSHANAHAGGHAHADAGWPAHVLEEKDVRLTLRGTIDRVDLSHDGRAARVVDYKRSRGSVRDGASGLGDTALQVPLYARVVEERVQRATTGFYLATQPRDAGVDSGPKAAARMEELVRSEGGARAEIERRALAIVRATRDGRIAPLPATEAQCRTCSVSGGCRKPRFAMTPEDDLEEET